MRRFVMLLLALALVGVTSADVLDAQSPTSTPPAGSDSAPGPGLLDGGILRDGTLPADAMKAPLDSRATPSAQR